MSDQQRASRTEAWLNAPYPTESMQSVKDHQERIAKALEYIATYMYRIDATLSATLERLNQAKDSR